MATRNELRESYDLLASEQTQNGPTSVKVIGVGLFRLVLSLRRSIAVRSYRRANSDSMAYLPFTRVCLTSSGILTFADIYGMYY